MFQQIGWPRLATQPHRATVGRERAFQSLAAVSQYEAGHRAFPAAISAEVGTPMWMGWADRRDAEGAAGMDDMGEWAHSHAAECGRHL